MRITIGGLQKEDYKRRITKGGLQKEDYKRRITEGGVSIQVEYVFNGSLREEGVRLSERANDLKNLSGRDISDGTIAME